MASKTLLLVEEYTSNSLIKQVKFIFLSTPEAELFKSQNQEIYDEHDGRYEQNRIKYTEIDTEKQKKLESIFKNVKNYVDDDKNTGNYDDENIYEEYEENIYEDYNYEAYIHEKYNPRYANDPQTPESNREIISRLTKRKWTILLLISFLSIVGIAVGLSVHFMTPEPLKSSTSFQGIFIEPSHRHFKSSIKNP